MNVMKAVLCAISSTAVVSAALLSIPALPAQAQDAPELRPGEVAFAADNCTIVYSPEEMKSWSVQKPNFNGYTWTGECRYGLIHGTGTMRPKVAAASDTETQSEAFLGRMMSRTVMTMKDPARTLVYYTAGGETVMFQNIGEDMRPRWGADASVIMVTGADRSNWMISESTTNCTSEPEKYKGCKGKGYTVYRVFYSANDKGKSTSYFVDCPDPRTTVGCETVWDKYGAGPMAGAKAMLKFVATKESATKAELTALTDPAQVLQRRVMAAANKELEAKELAERQAVAAEAQKEADIIVAKEQKLRAEAKEKSDREYKAKLAAMNAGQLFALADQQRTDGKAGEARDTLRTLISRFPDHALTTTAATMLAGLK